jgi:hypothetical protein
MCATPGTLRSASNEPNDGPVRSCCLASPEADRVSRSASVNSNSAGPQFPDLREELRFPRPDRADREPYVACADDKGASWIADGMPHAQSPTVTKRSNQIEVFGSQ